MGYWWLRSAYSSSNVRNVNNDGNDNNDNPNNLNNGLWPAVSVPLGVPY